MILVIFFSFFFSPLLINVIHWLIHRIAEKEKSSSLLLLRVALTGQYPVITNPTNHNRLSFKDFKQIGDYYHLSGSFSTYSPFHVTDPLMVSLEITVLTGRLWSSSQFLIFLLWLPRRSSSGLGTSIWFPWQAGSLRLLCARPSAPLWQAASSIAEGWTSFWAPFAQILISTALVCKLRVKRLVQLALTWCTWKVWRIYDRIMWSPAPIYELIICTEPPSKCRRLPFNQGLH